MQKGSHSRWVQSVVFHCSILTHPCRLCLKAIISANRLLSRPWMWLAMCVVWFFFWFSKIINGQSVLRQFYVSVISVRSSRCWDLAVAKWEPLSAVMLGPSATHCSLCTLPITIQCTDDTDWLTWIAQCSQDTLLSQAVIWLIKRRKKPRSFADGCISLWEVFAFVSLGSLSWLNARLDWMETSLIL